MVTTDSGRLAARDVVIALGLRRTNCPALHLRCRSFVKRGYHMHYEAQGTPALTAVLDLERGYP